MVGILLFIDVIAASNAATVSIICVAGMGGGFCPTIDSTKASSSARSESTGGSVSCRVCPFPRRMMNTFPLTLRRSPPCQRHAPANKTAWLSSKASTPLAPLANSTRTEIVSSGSGGGRRETDWAIYPSHRPKQIYESVEDMQRRSCHRTARRPRWGDHAKRRRICSSSGCCRWRTTDASNCPRLITNPSILLMDEPSEGLAPVVVEQLVSAIRSLVGGSNLSVLLVEQRMDYRPRSGEPLHRDGSRQDRARLRIAKTIEMGQSTLAV